MCLVFSVCVGVSAAQQLLLLADNDDGGEATHTNATEPCAHCVRREYRESKSSPKREGGREREREERGERGRGFNN